DELGDLGFDDLRGGARITGADGDDGRTGVRILAQRQLHERKCPKHDQHQTDHGGKYRTFYGNIRKNHLLHTKGRLRRNQELNAGSDAVPEITADLTSGRLLTLTVWPGRNWVKPSVTTS